jgi:hypothetical protein
MLSPDIRNMFLFFAAILAISWQPADLETAPVSALQAVPYCPHMLAHGGGTSQIPGMNPVGACHARRP